MENAQPIPRVIYDKLLASGIEILELNFSGGNDEGYLEIDMSPGYNSGLRDEIDEWAWDAYQYSGAGDGSDYGDNIVYDLKKKTATCSHWYMERTEAGCETQSFEIE